MSRPNRPLRSIILCTTPRSGSTLLCALLAASGVAGRPESWFRAEDRADYAADWGLSPGAGGQIDPQAFRAAAIGAGSGADGTFGLRLQAATLPAVLADLGARPGQARPAFEAAFGPCSFVWMRRRDTVAQAVSRLKAEVSGIWHLDGSEPDRPTARPAYDAGAIDRFRAEAAAGNALWRDWLAAEGIAAAQVLYEDFAPDPAGGTRRLLAELGLAPVAPLVVPNRRMADAESAGWAGRYRAERGLADGT